MMTGSPTAPRAPPPPPAPAATGARRWTADDIASLVLLYGGGNARAHQQLQVVAQVIRDNCLDGEMLSTEYESLDSVMAMLREECAASGGQLDGPRYTRVAKLLRELLLDPEKERQHRADVQRLSREQRDALYSPKFERAPAAASPPWSGGQEMKLQSEMLQTYPAADPRATAELEMLRQSQAECGQRWKSRRRQCALKRRRKRGSKLRGQSADWKRRQTKHGSWKWNPRHGSKQRPKHGSSKRKPRLESKQMQKHELSKLRQRRASQSKR